MYNEYFIVSQELRSKKRKKLVYMEKFLRYQNAETHEQHSTEKRTTLPNACILNVFHNLSYQNPKLHAKLDLYKKKNDITRKVSFESF